MLTNALSAELQGSGGIARIYTMPGRYQRVDPPVFAERRIASFDRYRHGIETSPREALVRTVQIADGLAAEIVEARGQERLEISCDGAWHTLVVYEEGARRDGDTFVEGLPRSTLREVARRLTFVPAGRRYSERYEPRAAARILYLHVDPDRLASLGGGSGELSDARMFFEDAAVFDAALKLKRSLEAPGAASPIYVEALGIVLVHELLRAARDAQAPAPARGGLAAWQQRAVTAYIDEHLEETIPLATLAKLARLSPYHFCRAFKQSLGVPPHRFHTSRRIEHAKELLAARIESVTEIGMAVGYRETSSFTAAFRKATGTTPSAYQRSLA